VTNLVRLPNKLDRKGYACRAVIETPSGCRSKYDYDVKAKLFRLKTVLPDGMSFPVDFGFIPSTLAEDGDPEDIMVLTDEPSATGALIDTRLIGVIELEETEDGKTERNDRIIAVAAVSHLYAKVNDLADLGKDYTDNLARFWINKNAIEGKQVRVLGLRGPDRAVKLIEKAMKAASKAA
jgi:inorganic pyrophosphatase